VEQAVALDSNFTDAWSELVRLSVNLRVSNAGDSTLDGRVGYAVRELERLVPGSAKLHVARSRELAVIRHDEAGAQRELEAALRLAPNDVTVLVRAAAGRATAGDVPGALTYLEHARELDPRSPIVLRTLLTLYVRSGRFRDALAVADVIAAVSPTDVGVARAQVNAYVRVGDLTGAQAAIRGAFERGVPRAALVANLVGTEEYGWALEDADQRLALRLTPSAFDGERDWWAQSLATLSWQRGDTAAARAYADSALAPTRAAIAAAKGPSQSDGLLAVMLGYLGRAAEARAAAARALTDKAAAQVGYNELNAARSELALGNRAAALDLLERITPAVRPMLPAELRFDPAFASLKGDPRLEKLVQAK